MTEHRSFPDAGNGLPILPMQAELWAAGCDIDTARFVAGQLDAEGYTLIRAEDIGFFVRCIMALFRRKPDPVENYQQAAARLLNEVKHER